VLREAKNGGDCPRRSVAVTATNSPFPATRVWGCGAMYRIQAYHSKLSKRLFPSDIYGRFTFSRPKLGRSLLHINNPDDLQKSGTARYTSKFLVRVTYLPPPIWYGLLSLAVIYAFYRLFTYDSRRRHLPPGPRGWPIVPNSFQLSFFNNPAPTLLKWTKDRAGPRSLAILSIAYIEVYIEL
jgi:hypothetical protein